MVIQRKELQARRVIAQALSPSDAMKQLQTAVDVAYHMLASQAQNYRGSITALALRSQVNEEAVEAAYADYSVVRTWTQRGTIHAICAQDLWLTQVIGARGLASVAASARRLDIDSGTYEDYSRRIIELTMQLRSRDELKTELGIDASIASNLLRRLGRLGLIVQGKKIGRHDSFIATAALNEITMPEDPIREIVRRYFSSRGPAQIADCMWWSTLSKTTIAKELDALISTGELLTITCDNKQYYMGRWQENVVAKEIDKALQLTRELPPFDELIMAYTDRDEVFHPQIDRLRVLTKNGLSWASTLHQAEIIGRVGE
ncbi:DNA glycosylase AlkZ-like family protein [Corynebacterium kutscheri]|uniref:DNA glycosylase AlkZ-like family protein n=1 Tax=Corynebacterium kutscheri TaxID=35755 RepID=UPI0037C05927